MADFFVAGFFVAGLAAADRRPELAQERARPAGNIPKAQATAGAPPPSRKAGNAGPRNSSLQKQYHDTGRGQKTSVGAAT